MEPFSLGLLGPGPLTAPWSVAVKTRPCGGKWPACGRSTPSSRKSSTRYTAGLQGARCPLLGWANCAASPHPPQLIQFLISLVQSNRILGVKRKM